jgi:general secretion pathway protein M
MSLARSRRRLAPLSPKQRRVLAVALLVPAVLIVLSVVVLPVYFIHRHYSVALDELQDRLTRYQRVAVQQGELKKAIDELAAKNAKKFYLKASAPNLAGAELSDLVRAAIEGNGGRIQTIQVAQPKDDGRYRQITVSLQMAANVVSMQKILNAIETQQPYVFVDNLTLRALIYRGFRAQPGVEPEMNAQMDVSAFAQIGTN